MAHRLTSRVRTALVATAMIGAAAAAVPTIAAAAPAASPHAKPTINSVQKRLGELAMRNDQLIDQYNRAQAAYRARLAAASKAHHLAVVAHRQLSRAQNQLGAAAAAEYEGGTFSSTGALLESNSGSNYLNQLDTLDMLSSHNAQVVSTFTGAKRAASSAQHHALALLHQATVRRDQVAQNKRTVKKQITKYTKLLATLNAQQRAQWESTLAPQVNASQISKAQGSLTGATPAAARTAVRFALQQVGKPYVWGAGGPSSYDCSGLTMASWNAAGISLPHSAAEQYNYGTHVSFDALQPGDLLFWYQPIGHVAIYIGNGLMVTAPEPGEDVQIAPADQLSSDYVGATRLVG